MQMLAAEIGHDEASSNVWSHLHGVSTTRVMDEVFAARPSSVAIAFRYVGDAWRERRSVLDSVFGQGGLLQERDRDVSAEGGKMTKKFDALECRFFLDSLTRENYTFVSCFIQMKQRRCSTSIGSAGKRNQGKASKQWQHTQGTRSFAFPEVFNRQCSCSVSRVIV